MFVVAVVDDDANVGDRIPNWTMSCQTFYPYLFWSCFISKFIFLILLIQKKTTTKFLFLHFVDEYFIHFIKFVCFIWWRREKSNKTNKYYIRKRMDANRSYIHCEWIKSQKITEDLKYTNKIEWQKEKQKKNFEILKIQIFFDH